MKTAFYIFLLLPNLLFGQFQELKFYSEFEKKAFDNISENQSLKNKLSLFFALDTTITSDGFEQYYQMLTLLNTEKKLHKNPRRLFSEVQNSLLLHFEQNAAFTSVVTDSIFNCVSGSALLAFFLEYNQMNYEIEEMPYHVFITASNKKRKYILESTDTQYGFLPDIPLNRKNYETDTIDNSEIFKIIGSYSNLDNGSITVKGKISLVELAGLNYYNDAVLKINSGNYEEAVYQLQKAYLLYPSQRVNEVLKFSLLKILDDDTKTKTEKMFFYELLVKHTYSYSYQN